MSAFLGRVSSRVAEWLTCCGFIDKPEVLTRQVVRGAVDDPPIAVKRTSAGWHCPGTVSNWPRFRAICRGWRACGCRQLDSATTAQSDRPYLCHLADSNRPCLTGVRVESRRDRAQQNVLVGLGLSQVLDALDGTRLVGKSTAQPRLLRVRGPRYRRQIDHRIALGGAETGDH